MYNRQCLYLYDDADANTEMPKLRFPNGLLSVYRERRILSNFKMAAPKRLKIKIFLACMNSLRFSLWLKY